MSEKQNLSVPNIYEYGTIVNHPVFGDGVVDHEFIRPTDPEVGYVYWTTPDGLIHASGYTYYADVLFFENRLITVPITELTRITERKFLLWRHPSGQWMHGKNGMIGAALRYLLLLGFSVYGMTQLKYSSNWLFMVFVPLMIIAVMLYGLHRNYLGKQM